MSRIYRVEIQEQLRRHVKAEDGLRSRLELLPILPAPRLGELLGAELAARGFQVEAGRAVRKGADGVTVAVDLPSGEVSISVEAEREVELRTRQVGAVAEPEDRPEAEAQLRRRAAQNLAEQEQAEVRALRREVTQVLEGKLKDLQAELDQSVNRVTAAALKERAAQLGTIQEVHEDPTTGSLTIKVKV